MMKTVRHSLPALPVIVAALAYGIAESIALSRSRASDTLRDWWKRISAP